MDFRFLSDGGQTADEIARQLAAFLDASQTSLDLAIYDFHLSPTTATPIIAALANATKRGVAIRLVHNQDHARAVPVPPPPAPASDFLRGLGVPVRGINGVPDLMHQKYIVRDGVAVWTGSTNWTDDSWTREENVIVIVESADVAAAFSRDFEDLWRRQVVQNSGRGVNVAVVIGQSTVRPWFSPGQGRQLSHRIATAIGRAERRVRICSPVITNGAILGTLGDAVCREGLDVAGIVDATQVREVLGQWARDPRASWKTPALLSVFANAPFSGKVSTPYAPGTVHDYMHAKFVVVDHLVFVGSYNLSGSGQDNAENVLEIADAAVADRFALFADQLRARYPAVRFSSARAADGEEPRTQP